MGKYEIGARVRDEDGDEGVITNKSKGERKVRHDKTIYGDIWHDKTSLHVIDAPKFSAGDRVRLVKSTGFAAEVGAEATVSERALHYNDICDDVLLDLVWDEVDARHGQSHGAYYPKDFELAPVAEVPAPVITPTLTIEAGKFYRTRDGRKVAVVHGEQYPNGPWLFRTANHSHYFQRDGKSCRGINGFDNHAEDDLVAEWVDPVVETAQPKFKKGDRVRSTERGDDTFGMIGTVYLVDTVGDVDVTFEGYTEGHHGSTNDSSVNHRWFFDGDNLELAQAPVTPLPAVGTKVTLTCTVTGHNPVDKTNINVVVDGLPAGRNSLGISPSALKAA